MVTGFNSSFLDNPFGQEITFFFFYMWESGIVFFSWRLKASAKKDVAVSVPLSTLHFLWKSSPEVFLMTSVLFELRVKNRVSERASHVVVGHWPRSSNYHGPVKSSLPLAVRFTAGRKSSWLTGPTPEVDWTRKWSHGESLDCSCVNVCVSLDFLSSASLRL